MSCDGGRGVLPRGEKLEYVVDVELPAVCEGCHYTVIMLFACGAVSLL